MLFSIKIEFNPKTKYFYPRLPFNLHITAVCFNSSTLTVLCVCEFNIFARCTLFCYGYDEMKNKSKKKHCRNNSEFYSKSHSQIDTLYTQLLSFLAWYIKCDRIKLVLEYLSSVLWNTSVQSSGIPQFSPLEYLSSVLWNTSVQSWCLVTFVLLSLWFFL